jgi:hypothetical protein
LRTKSKQLFLGIEFAAQRPLSIRRLIRLIPIHRKKNPGE